MTPELKNPKTSGNINQGEANGRTPSLLEPVREWNGEPRRTPHKKVTGDPRTSRVQSKVGSSKAFSTFVLEPFQTETAICRGRTKVGSPVGDFNSLET